MTARYLRHVRHGAAFHLTPPLWGSHYVVIAPPDAQGHTLLLAARRDGSLITDADGDARVVYVTDQGSAALLDLGYATDWSADA